MVTSDTDSTFSQGDVQVNSPARINPKKPRQQAAQSMALSNIDGSFDHMACIRRRRDGVIGSLLPRTQSGLFLWIPLSTYDSLGKDVYAGSERPTLIC